jgi:hypothetical protein
VWVCGDGGAGFAQDEEILDVITDDAVVVGLRRFTMVACLAASYMRPR